MKLHSLFIQIIIALVVVAEANVIVHSRAGNSVPRQLLRHGEQAAVATDLFLGNSTMAAGLDETSFAEAFPGSRPLNLGLGSSSPVEHYLIYLKQDRHHNANVYYGFLDTQLTDQPEGSWSTLVGNRAMSYYAGVDVAIGFYAADEPIKAAILRVVARTPMLVDRYAIWSKVELLRRKLGALGMPQLQTNRFGRAADFALLEPADEKAFARRCRADAENGVPLNAAVTAILRHAREQSVSAFIIEMPLPQQHRQRFYGTDDWNAYRTYVDALISKEGAVLVPAADWVTDDGFADNLHLNAAGAKSFSSRLGHWLSAR
jgi:hypothetical protein